MALYSWAKSIPPVYDAKNPTALFFPLHRQLFSHLVLLRKQHLHLHVLSDSSAGPSPWRLTPTVRAATVGCLAPSPDCKDACKDAYKDLASAFFPLSTDLSPPLPALTNILPYRIPFFLFPFLGTHWAAPRLSCGTRDLWLSLRPAGSFVVAVGACGISFPDQGWSSSPLCWELRVLATGPPGKSIDRISLFSFFLIICHWRINALQYCVGFCHILAWISHKYTYVPCLLNLPSISHPIPPPRLSQSTGLSSLHHTTNPHWLSVLHVVMDVFQC